MVQNAERMAPTTTSYAIAVRARRRVGVGIAREVSSGRLTTGKITGLAIGVTLGLVLFLAVTWFYWKRRCRGRRQGTGSTVAEPRRHGALVERIAEAKI